VSHRALMPPSMRVDWSPSSRDVVDH
jgi:hypothetical protein